MAQLDREALQRELAQLPRELMVAIAVRAAMRVLPVLAWRPPGSEPFGYWSNDRDRYANAIIRCQATSVVWATGGIAAARDADAAAAAVAAPAPAAAAYAVAAAAAAASIEADLKLAQTMGTAAQRPGIIARLLGRRPGPAYDAAKALLDTPSGPTASPTGSPLSSPASKPTSSPSMPDSTSGSTGIVIGSTASRSTSSCSPSGLT